MKNPGSGYRWVKRGEVQLATDEYQVGVRWRRTLVFGDIHGGYQTYRRRSSPKKSKP